MFWPLFIKCNGVPGHWVVQSQSTLRTRVTKTYWVGKQREDTKYLFIMPVGPPGPTRTSLLPGYDAGTISLLLGP